MEVSYNCCEVLSHELDEMKFVMTVISVSHPWKCLVEFGGLEATYDDLLRLIENRVVDFLLVLIELFSLGVTAEALRASIGSKSAISLQRGPVNPKFHQPTINHFSSQITRLNDFSRGLKIWTDLSSVSSQSTCLTDRRTDRHFSHR